MINNQRKSIINELGNNHGGDIYSYMELIGKKPLDYSANINPLGLPEEVKNALSLNLDSYCDYPDVHCRSLKKEVSRYEGIEEQCLLFGNGAADIIYRLCYALTPKKALLLAPTFSEYGQALSQIHCEIDYFYLKPEKAFTLEEEILDCIRGKDIFFLCNPNNPTGKTVNQELLIKIAKKCEENNCIFVMDECFMDFVYEKENYSFKKYFRQFENVIILKAFTKIYAMPGLRLGYCISSNKKLLKEIELAGQVWSVSVPAQIAGVAALQDKEYLSKTVTLIDREREYLTNALKEFGFTVFESFTNFLLFQTVIEDLYEKLYHKGILIRKCVNFMGLDNSFYRMAIKDRKNNEIFIHTIKEVLNNG